MFRRISIIVSLTLTIGTFALTHSAATESVECSAEGSFEITSEDTPTRRIQFNARMAASGAISGEITIQDDAAVADATTEAEASPPFFIKAEINCLTIKGNRALLSGNVTDASIERYIGGQIVLLAVDEDGDMSQKPDRLTWRFHKPRPKDWLATDSELGDDQINPVGWMARDSERDDDEGKVISVNNDTVRCESQLLSSSSFSDENHARGNVKVRQ